MSPGDREEEKNMKKLMNLVLALAVASSLMSVPVKAADLNWTNTNGVWTLNDDKGNLIKGWYKDQNNCWYMLDWKTGAMKTGWVASGSEWYYLNLLNGIMQTGWQKINGEWYYLQTSGAKAGSMLTGSMLLDGAKQNFNENGKLVNKGDPMFTGYANVDAYIKKTLAEIIKPDMSEREELKAIHDYVAATLTYGTSGDYYSKGDPKVDKLLGKLEDGLKRVPSVDSINYSELVIYNGYEALMSGKGVCGDYTDAFRILANALGYKTSYMNGKYNKSGHEWALVWLDGEWLIMDVQLDDSVEGKLLDIGFLKSYANQENHKAVAKYFDYYNPEDHFIQNTKASLIEHPEYVEKFGTFDEQTVKYSQNYLYTGSQK